MKLLLPSFCLLILAGCAGYHLGPVNKVESGARTIEIQPVNNQTLIPRLGDDMTQAIRERVQTDGTFRLATSGPGDLMVSSVIRSYTRQELGNLSSDTSSTMNFRVTAVVHVVVRDRATGKVIMDRDIKGHTLINVGPDFASSERQAAPLLAADVAQNLVSHITEGVW